MSLFYGIVTGIIFGFLLQKARVLKYGKQVGAFYEDTHRRYWKLWKIQSAAGYRTQSLDYYSPTGGCFDYLVPVFREK
jgi:hypothetical protein